MIRVDEEGRPCSASAGGPLLVVPAEVASSWRGASDYDERGSDYDRACDPEDYEGTSGGGTGWVDVGGARALVLAGSTGAHFVRERDGGCLVRDHAGGGNPASIGDGDWRLYQAAKLVLRDGRLFMFDAALPGNHDPAAIDACDGVAVLDLGPGEWTVSLATDADENDFVRVRRV